MTQQTFDTVEDCINFIRTNFGRDILAQTFMEIGQDNLQKWQNEVYKRTNDPRWIP